MTAGYPFLPALMGHLKKVKTSQVASVIAKAIDADAAHVRHCLISLGLQGEVVSCNRPMNMVPDDLEFRLAAVALEIKGTPGPRPKSAKYSEEASTERAHAMGTIGPATPPVQRVATVLPAAQVVAIMARPKSGVRQYSMGAREKALAAIVNSPTPIACSAIAAGISYHQTQISRIVADLVEEGLIKRVGSGSHTRYVPYDRHVDPAEHIPPPKPRKPLGDGVLRTCLDTLAIAEWPMSTRELSEATGWRQSSICNTIWKSADRGECVRVGQSKLSRYYRPDTLAEKMWLQREDEDRVRRALAQGQPVDVSSQDGSRFLLKKESAMGTDPVPTHTHSVVVLRTSDAGGAKASPQSPGSRMEVPTFDVNSPTDGIRPGESLISWQLRTGSIPEVGGGDEKFLKPDDQLEVERVLTLLREQLSHEEYRGYLRGTLCTLALRGTSEDLKRQKYFGIALAEVA